MCLSEDRTLQLRQQHISILTRSLIETQNARVRLELMSYTRTRTNAFIDISCESPTPYAH